MAIKADYLVKGAGASSMAFVVAMLPESNATFAIVDKRHAPGGHWNDAYQFVRLHQPSACYGVGSRELGTGRKDESGFNKGLYELASGVEVTDYFHRVMRDTFLPSGRVRYFPVSEVQGDNEIVSLLSGERQRVDVGKKIVDGTMLQTSIPLTHQRKFTVADGVACIPPNDLTRMAPKHQNFCVLGAGKTAIDSVLWLLANGAAPESIAWVLPRDPWLWNRAASQPGVEMFDRSIRAIADHYEVLATAKSVREVCEGSERAGVWLRLDQDVWPSMFHAATVTTLELDQMRRIANKIRKGRVKRIEKDRIVLDQGEEASAPDTLYVDCTARALEANVNDKTPVFSPGRISLQMLRIYQPTFSSALIGYLEATMDDDAEKAKYARPAPMTDTVEHWLKGQAASMSNQGAWMSNTNIAMWMLGCRLDLFSGTMAKIKPDDPEKGPVLAKLRANYGPAIQNLLKLASAA